MKNILIVKTGAAGDVLRTTFVLDELTGRYNVYWLTDKLCIPLIDQTLATVVSSTKEIEDIQFDTIYSLEEELDLVADVQKLNYTRLIGCYVVNNTIAYSAPSELWFDMSMISKYGIHRANELKLTNKKTFQELVAAIFDFKFTGQCYNKLTYNHTDAIISGDIAIAKTAGNKWPNKNWAYYDELKLELETLGYVVNYLPNRQSIKEHIADIAAHKLVICGDSLPMHIATALKVPSIALFTCTSPDEIYSYDLITKIISTKLTKFYYQREFDINCPTGILITDVLHAATKNVLK